MYQVEDLDSTKSNTTLYQSICQVNTRSFNAAIKEVMEMKLMEVVNIHRTCQREKFCGLTRLQDKFLTFPQPTTERII